MLGKRRHYDQVHARSEIEICSNSCLRRRTPRRLHSLFHARRKLKSALSSDPYLGTDKLNQNIRVSDFAMISFASFPSTSEASASYANTRHHPEVEDDVGMDLDEDDFEENVQRLTVPGEPITSSHAFMRYAHSTDQCLQPA